MRVISFALFIAVSAFAAFGFGLLGAMAYAMAQGADAGDAYSQVCANNGATLRYIVEGLLGTSVGASLIANLRGLPPGLVKFLDMLALNFFATASKAKSSAPVIFACAIASFLIACALTGKPAWTPVQVAYFEVEAGIAAEAVAQEVLAQGVPASDVAFVAAGGQGLAAAIVADVSVLENGGSTAAQIEAAGLSALVSLVNNLGSILSAAQAPAGAVDPKALALQGGIDVLRQVPALVGVATALDNGFMPDPQKDIAPALAQLAGAASKLGVSP